MSKSGITSPHPLHTEIEYLLLRQNTHLMFQTLHYIERWHQAKSEGTLQTKIQQKVVWILSIFLLLGGINIENDAVVDAFSTSSMTRCRISSIPGRTIRSEASLVDEDPSPTEPEETS